VTPKDQANSKRRSRRNESGQASFLAGVAKGRDHEQKGHPGQRSALREGVVIKTTSRRPRIITVDAVAIGEIGYIGNDYSEGACKDPEGTQNRSRNCDGQCEPLPRIVVPPMSRTRRFKPCKRTTQNSPREIGSGSATRTAFRRTVDSSWKAKGRRSPRYSMPPDEEVAEVGPIDPPDSVFFGWTSKTDRRWPCLQLRLPSDHGVPNGENNGGPRWVRRPKVIENNLSEGTIALFVQGCGGDSIRSGTRRSISPHAEPWATGSV